MEGYIHSFTMRLMGISKLPYLAFKKKVVGCVHLFPNGRKMCSSSINRSLFFSRLSFNLFFPVPVSSHFKPLFLSYRGAYTTYPNSLKEYTMLLIVCSLNFNSSPISFKLYLGCVPTNLNMFILFAVNLIFIPHCHSTKHLLYNHHHHKISSLF